MAKLSRIRNVLRHAYGPSPGQAEGILQSALNGPEPGAGSGYEDVRYKKANDGACGSAVRPRSQSEKNCVSDQQPPV